MSIGNANLHQRGEIPEIVKLPNGRIRIIRRFHKFTREDIDNAALGSTMGNFGDLDTTGEQIANQGYTDCRLISVEVDTRFNSLSNADNAVLVKTYETLTSSFVQITDDTVEFDDNGLKRVTRVYRAISGTTSSNVVGTATITSGSTTLYLASSKLDDNDAFAELTEEYIEAGILSINKDYVSEGVCRVTTTFLVTEGTVIGPIIGRAIGDNDGLKTIAVTHMQQSDGTSLIDDSTPAVSHKMLDNFTYPGTVRLDYEALTGSGTYSFAAVDYALESPVNAKIPAVMEIHFRTNDTITYPTGYPLWNPTEWAYGESKGIAWNYVPFSISRAFRGYRTTATGAYQNNDHSGSGKLGVVGSTAWDMISGRRIFANTTFHIYVEGGPADPVGNQYTLDYRISEAFQDLSGTKYYKHVIIRTDGNVPQQ